MTYLTMTKMKSDSNIDTQKIKQAALYRDKHILKLLGFDVTSGYKHSCECPVHGGDNPSGFSYDFEKHIWSCFTHKCHSLYGNDIIGLIRCIKKISFSDALIWINENIIENQDIDWDEIDKEIGTHNYIPQSNKIFDESHLNKLKKDYSSISDRNFKKETIELFQGGLCLKPNEPWHNRFMIPIRNEYGQITGFTGRSIYPKDERTGLYFNGHKPTRYQRLYSKWLNYPLKGFNKSLELYNIDKAKNEIYKTNTAILVEGPFDVWRVFEYGTKNVVATLGVSLSKHQIELLKKHGCINLVLLYDQDKAGKDAQKEIVKKTKDTFRVYIPKLPDNIKDPGDLTEKQYNEYIVLFLEKINV